jgi:hypothetical protein
VKRRAATRCRALVATTALAAATAASAAVRSVPGQDRPGVFDITLRPVRDGGPEVVAIDVRADLSGLPESRAEAFVLRAPIVYAGVPGIADRVRGLTVEDAGGPVDLRARDDEPAPGGFPYFRHWSAVRPVRFPVKLAYRSLVQPAGAPDGPPFGIRPAGGGVSGAGSGFLVLPEGDLAVTNRVRWDLSDLDPGSVAVSSFGEGDFELDGSPASLMGGWLLAGPAGRYPETGDAGGFSAAWLGTPPFDAEDAMSWAAGMYRHLGESFPHLDPAPRYRVFMRFLDTPPFGGGTALTNSFMLSRGIGTGVAEAPPRETFVHEMVHLWVGGIQGPTGVTSWFNEGLTMRGGFTSVDEYGESVNETFRDYWTSPGRDLSADSIARIGFADSRIRHVPYQRGSLYLADLDARIREASGGARTLDMLLARIFVSRERGERFDRDAWVAAVEAEIGSPARDIFEAVILGGEPIVPASGAFGPCFERRPARLDDPEHVEVLEGFEWVRLPGIPDERCREW